MHYFSKVYFIFVSCRHHPESFTKDLLCERLRRYTNVEYSYEKTKGTMFDAVGRASILVPLFLRDGEVHVLLTRRSAHLRSHSGDVAFPGGKRDDTDKVWINQTWRVIDFVYDNNLCQTGFDINKIKVKISSVNLDVFKSKFPDIYFNYI